MNLVLTVAEIAAPVFILAGIGFTWVKLGFEYRIRFVTQLAMTLGVPCLIFTALMQTEIRPEALAAISLATLAAYVVLTLLFCGLLKVRNLDQRTFLSPLVFGNTGNLGLPLALFAFGETGLEYAVVVFAVMAIYFFSFGTWHVAGGGSILKMVREPIVGATALGGLFLWHGWKTPVFLTNTLELVGQLAIPLMLITLGVAIARLDVRGLGRSAWMSLLKAVICVAVAMACARAFELDRVAEAVLILQLATPVAVTSYLLAEKYGADADAVAGLVVISTLISVALLPLILAFVI